jgi:hypothetical protein
MTLNATVQISLADLTTLQKSVDDAQLETAAVRAELLEARLASPDGKVADVTAFARDCLTLARFAVAHCPPETTVGWPFDVLRRVCDGIEKLPDYSLMDRDMAIDLRGFATECEDIERKRQAVKPGVVPLPIGERPGVAGGDAAAYSTTTLGGDGT